MNARLGARLRSLLTMPWIWAIGVAVVAFGLHLAIYPIGDPDADTDFYGDLVLAAKHLASGELDVRNYPYKGPLFSFVLVALHAVVRDWYHAAVLLNALAAAGCLLVLHRLLRALFSTEIATWGMVLFSVVPTFFSIAHGTHTDLLFLLLVLASLLALLTGPTSMRRAALAGWWAGLAYSTRSAGIVLVVAALPVLLYFRPPTSARRLRLQSCACYLAAFLAVVGPWLLLSRAQTGQFLYTRNTENISSGLYDPVRWGSMGQETKVRPVWQLVTYDPKHVAQQLVHNWREHVRKDATKLLGIPAAVLPLLGLAGIVLRMPSGSQWGLYLFGFLYFLALGAVFYSPRFSLPLAPVYLASGLAFLGRFAASTSDSSTAKIAPASRRLVRITTYLFLLACLAAGIVRIVGDERERMARRPAKLLPGIAALRTYVATAGPGALMGRKGLVALHAGLDYVPYPRAIGFSLRDLLSYAQKHNVRYISYGRLEFELVPDLRYLAMVDTLPGTRDIFRADGDRIFEVIDYDPVVTQRQELQMLTANATIASRLGKPILESNACNVIAKYYMDRGFPLEALPWLQRALEVVAESPIGTPEARVATTTRSNLGVVLLYLGRPAEARPHLQHVLEYFEHNGSREDRGNTMILLAAADEQEHKLPSAIERLQTARKLFTLPADHVRVDSMLVAIERMQAR